MIRFVAYGRWTRISSIRLPDSYLDMPNSVFINKLEKLLNGEIEVIASGYSPGQTLFVYDMRSDIDIGYNYYDLFDPLQTREIALPESKPGHCLILEQSSHGWAFSHEMETFDQHLFEVEWLSMPMPSGQEAIFGQPFYDGIALTHTWPPYSLYEKKLKVLTKIYGVYPDLAVSKNDAKGRSIAPEYPDCGSEIMDWRSGARMQTGWAAIDGKWSPEPIRIPSSREFVWPEDGFPSHPITVIFRERLNKMYASLLDVGIFGEDLVTSWSAGECGSDVYDHVEERMDELGPILGITKWDQASVCWSGTHYGEDDSREGDMHDHYDPDGRVEDLTDRFRTDLFVTLKPETSVYVYFESNKRAKLTPTQVAQHIVKKAFDAGLVASWNGSPKSAIRVSLAE